MLYLLIGALSKKYNEILTQVIEAIMRKNNKPIREVAALEIAKSLVSFLKEGIHWPPREHQKPWKTMSRR